MFPLASTPKLVCVKTYPAIFPKSGWERFPSYSPNLTICCPLFPTHFCIPSFHEPRFTLTTRRHHCRSCGGSFCHACSTNRDLLTHYGLPQPERTCDACHKYLRSVSPTATDCNYIIPHYLSTIGGSQKYVHTPNNPTVITFSPFPAPGAKYEGTDEQKCRDAIKANDVATVKSLLEAKVDPGHFDKTGNTLLHLACIMDKFSLVKLLCDAGGNPYQPNRISQSETSYDVSSAAVKYKFRTIYPPENYNAPPIVAKVKVKKVRKSKNTAEDDTPAAIVGIQSGPE